MPKRVITCPECKGQWAKSGRCKRCQGIGMVTTGKNYQSDWRKPTSAERREIRKAIDSGKRQ